MTRIQHDNTIEYNGQRLNADPTTAVSNPGRWGRPSSAPHALRLSGADRYFRRADDHSAASVQQPRSKRPGTNNARPLRFLRLAINQMRAEQDSIEDAITGMEQLGRETADLLASLRRHFSQGPASCGVFDYALANRNLLGDVGRWIEQHLVPLAASRGRALTTSIDPRLEMLPAHVVFSLLIEHVRKRIYDSDPGTRLNLEIKLIDDLASIRVTEQGNVAPSVPITDESTRRLWERVVRQLGGSMSWSRLSDSPALNPSETHGSEIKIDYPVFSSRMFRLDRNPLAQCRWIPNSNAA